MNTRRSQFAALVLAAIVIFVAGYSALAMRSSAARLREAKRDEQTCRELIGKIQALKQRRGFAALQAETAQTITQKAQRSKEEANLPAGALFRIEPQSPLRLGDSAYKIRPTRIELRDVTLERLIRFAYSMTADEQGMSIRDLRLTATGPNDGNAGADRWSVEIVLTQLIFSPISR